MQFLHSEFLRAQKLAKDLALRAGKIISANLELGIKRDWKEDHTPVTASDKSINQLVLDTIHQEFPGHSILAEEGSDLTLSKEFIWVCDPLDGTLPFIHGIPTSTFTLALIQNGEPILGVIYDPFTNRLFSAAKAQGSMLNNLPIHTSTATGIADSSMGVLFWKGNMDIIAPLLAKLVQAGVHIFNPNSIAYMDALVAAGEFTATIFPGLSAHDSAAAKIIVEEAGGIFTSLTGEIDPYYRPVHGHLAGAYAKIHAQITAMMR